MLKDITIYPRNSFVFASAAKAPRRKDEKETVFIDLRENKQETDEISESMQRILRLNAGDSKE